MKRTLHPEPEPVIEEIPIAQLYPFNNPADETRTKTVTQRESGVKDALIWWVQDEDAEEIYSNVRNFVIPTQFKVSYDGGTDSITGLYCGVNTKFPRPVDTSELYELPFELFNKTVDELTGVVTYSPKEDIYVPAEYCKFTTEARCDIFVDVDVPEDDTVDVTVVAYASLERLVE